MKTKLLFSLLILLGPPVTHRAQQSSPETDQAVVFLHSASLSPRRKSRSLRLDGLFYETTRGRTTLPLDLTGKARVIASGEWSGQVTTADGRTVRVVVQPAGRNFNISLKAQPAADIHKWGFAIEAAKNEYYTGLMERVVDGHQRASWAPGLTTAMNLRGQKVEMIIKPTTSVYAPYYLSSRGYAVFVRSNWPGLFDFVVSDPTRVKIEFEG